MPGRWELDAGKTLFGVERDLRLRRDAYEGPTLVVAPLSTHSTWKSTYEANADLKVKVIDPKNRNAFVGSSSSNRADVYICHYQVLHLMPELRQLGIGHLVTDECVPLDTEALTPEGWKTYDRLGIGDQILGYENGQTCWVDVKAINVYGPREVGTVTVKGFEVVTTEAHEWATTYVTTNKHYDHYPVPTTPRIGPVTSGGPKPKGNEWRIVLSAPFIGGQTDITPDEASLIAWILGDGGIYPMKTYKGKPTSYSVFVYQTKPKMVGEIDLLLKRLSVGFTKTLINKKGQAGGFGSTKPRYKWRISIEYVRQLFDRAGINWKGFKNYDLTTFVLGLSVEALHAFLNTSYCAEGNNPSPPNTQHVLAQNPGKIHEAYRLAAFLSGYFPSVQKRMNNIGLTHPIKQAKNMKWKPHKLLQPVWCPTTSSGNWVMRQGSLICITGNCHALSGRKTKRTRAAKRLTLTEGAPYVTAMSGSPVANKPQDLWSILNLLKPRTYSSYWKFYSDFTKFKVIQPQGYHKTLGPSDAWFERGLPAIRPFYDRRLQDECLDIPPIVQTRIYVDLAPQQRVIYQDMTSRMLAWIEDNADPSGELSPLVARAAVSKLVRLQQIACGTPEFSEEGKVSIGDPSTKIDAIMERLAEDDTAQFVIFGKFKTVLRLLKERFDKAKPRITYCSYTGDDSQEQRERGKQEFIEGKRRIFVGTIAAGGAGIDGLQQASHNLIFIDRDWSPEINKQAIFRLKRAGQEHKVNVIDIVSKNTVDAITLMQVELKGRWITEMLNGRDKPD